jgi:protein SCO1/2
MHWKKVWYPVGLLLMVGLLGSALRAQAKLTQISDSVGIDQKLNARIPSDLVFRDEGGTDVRLSEYFEKDRPVVLALVYYECPMLCTEVLNGMVRSFVRIPYKLGSDFEVITVSIDPHEMPELARAKKETYLEGQFEAQARTGWHFLTGTQESIERLARAVGFRYFYDAETGQFAHAAGIMVLTPDGVISRYLYGIDYPSKDLRLALVEASERRIGTPVDRLMLLCYRYDPTTGTYGVVIMNVLRVAWIGTVGFLVALFVVLRKREKSRKLDVAENGKR